MITVIGTVEIPASALENLRPSMERMIAASRAEPGCIRYAYGVDVLNPCIIHVSEAWENRDVLAAHFQTPHIAVWRAALAEAGMVKRDLHLLEGTPEPT